MTGLASARVQEARPLGLAGPARALAELAERFDPLSLDQVGSATLLDRVDTKFLVQLSAVPQLIDGLADQYRALEVNGTRLGRYNTRYFDTPELTLYHAHHAGRLPRYKVRVRSYLESREQYLEVKLKNNKGRTLKDRTTLAAGEASLERVRREALQRMPGPVPGELIQTLTADFTRLTLVHRNLPERLTVDVGLTFGHEDEAYQFGGVAIVELKQVRHEQADSRDLLRRLYMRDSAVSKYCLGVAMLYARAKTNRFRRVLSALERIEREHSSLNG